MTENRRERGKICHIHVNHTRDIHVSGITDTRARYEGDEQDGRELRGICVIQR